MPPKQKSKAKDARTKRRREAELLEDLDLDVGNGASSSLRDTVDYHLDDDILHNRATRTSATKALDSQGYFDVLPSDAHKLEGKDIDDGERGADQEEEQLAIEAMRHKRRNMKDSDYIPADLRTPGSARRSSGKAKGEERGEEKALGQAVETVERDFAALSESERLNVLKEESPEVLKLIEEFTSFLKSAKEVIMQLRRVEVSKKSIPQNRPLLDFLATKANLLLMYCVHVTFYLLLKVDGQKVKGHPVIDRLVELRTYIEKLWTIEPKLQHSIGLLLSAGEGKGDTGGVRHSLRPLPQDESTIYQPKKDVASLENKNRRTLLKELREAKEVEKEEANTMSRLRRKTPQITEEHMAALSGVSKTWNLGGEEEEDVDHYFQSISARRSSGDDYNDGGGPGLSLIERLRAAGNTAAVSKVAQPKSNKKKQTEEVSEEMEEENEEEDDIYEQLVEEENKRESKQKEAQQQKPREALTDPEVSRRNIDQRIQTHRGLTKARPKDRKNPRTNQRRKFERGERVAKAHKKNHKEVDESGFEGVSQLKTHLHHSVKF